MGTNISPEITKKSKWWIPKHRYYELLHFCMQYRSWNAEKKEIEEEIHALKYGEIMNKPTYSDSEIEKKMLRIEKITTKMEMVELATLDADPYYSPYLFAAVTEGRSYNYLVTKLEMVTNKGMYYDRYRKFFWLLDKVRG